MNVAVVGARERVLASDEKLVADILEALRKKYARLVIVTVGCDQGVGCHVSMHCTRSKNPIQFVEYKVRVQANLNGSERANMFKCRNAGMFYFVDELHVLRSAKSSTIDDLIARSQLEKRPCYVYEEGQAEPWFTLASATTSA